MDAEGRLRIFNQGLDQLRTTLLQAFEDAANFIGSIPPLRSSAVCEYINQLPDPPFYEEDEGVSEVDRQLAEMFSGFKVLFDQCCEAIDDEDFQERVIMALVHPENPQAAEHKALESDESCWELLKAIRESVSALDLFKSVFQEDRKAIELLAKLDGLDPNEVGKVQLMAATHLTVLVGYHVLPPAPEV